MKTFAQSLRLLLAFTVLCGVAYPLLVTAVARAAFIPKAHGSLIIESGRVKGSSLVGQPFEDPRFFWGRPSATSPAYNGSASGGSNLGPTNPALIEAISGRVKALREADPSDDRPVPTELVTASASGLDPHLSPSAAEFQAARVARARGLTEEEVRRLILEHTDGPQFGLLGEPVVNVLRLNLALEKAAP
jgi:potassium-transporting ATPase KdpC subunit